MQVVLPSPLPPVQYPGVRGGGGVAGQAGGGSAMPPHTRGRTNSLPYPREVAGYSREGGVMGREEGRVRPPPPPAPSGRRVGEEERRVRRGGGERRLSAPSGRGPVPRDSGSDQFVIDHMVSLGLLLLPLSPPLFSPL